MVPGRGPTVPVIMSAKLAQAHLSGLAWPAVQQQQDGGFYHSVQGKIETVINL